MFEMKILQAIIIEARQNLIRHNLT